MLLYNSTSRLEAHLQVTCSNFEVFKYENGKAEEKKEGKRCMNKLKLKNIFKLGTAPLNIINI